jgi:hypothetical protein
VRPRTETSPRRPAAPTINSWCRLTASSIDGRGHTAFASVKRGAQSWTVFFPECEGLTSARRSSLAAPATSKGAYSCAMNASSSTEIAPYQVVAAPSVLVRRLASTLWAIATVLAIVAVVIVIASLSTPAPEAGYLRGSVALFALAWGTIGARIAARYPRNAVGWLMLATGLGFGVIAVTQELVIASLRGPGLAQSPEITVRFVRISAYLTSLAAGLTVLLFPDGRLPSRPWLLVGALVVATNALGVAIAALAPLPSIAGSANPFLDAENEYFKVQAYGLARYGGPLALAVCAGALLARVRRAGTVERQQLKWVAAGGGLAVVTNLLANALPIVPPLQVVQLLTLLAIPVAVGIAMTRYHLYNIDVILNRTLVYAIVSGFLAGLTAALVGAIQGTFVAVTGQRSDAAIVITTLILVAVFSPLRELAQRFVDRRFKRAAKGLTGLRSFETEVRTFAGISDPQRLVMRLLSESVATFEAVGGAAELRGPDGSYSVRPIGDWDGDSRVTTTISDGRGAMARIRLASRVSGDPYSEHEVAQLRDAADAVAEVLGSAS